MYASAVEQLPSWRIEEVCLGFIMQELGVLGMRNEEMEGLLATGRQCMSLLHSASQLISSQYPKYFHLHASLIDAAGKLTAGILHLRSSTGRNGPSLLFAAFYLHDMQLQAQAQTTALRRECARASTASIRSVHVLASALAWACDQHYVVVSNRVLAGSFTFAKIYLVLESLLELFSKVYLHPSASWVLAVP